MNAGKHAPAADLQQIQGLCKPQTLTLEQAAAMLNTNADTVSECIRFKGLPAVKIGRAYVLVDTDVLAWLRAQYGQPTGR